MSPAFATATARSRNSTFSCDTAYYSNAGPDAQWPTSIRKPSGSKKNIAQ
jgi:hypothetical protein